MITKIKQTLGITNRELTKAGIYKSQISRSKKDGFPVYYEILLNLILDELNTMKKADFIKKFISSYVDINIKADRKKITSEILGMRKWHEFKGLIIPEWLGLDLIDEIMKKLEA